MEESMVLEGSLDTISIDEVLEVIGISRQLMELELTDAQRPVGTILVKSGYLLDAKAPSVQSGRDAFLHLYRRPGRDFMVHRRSADLTAVRPIGSLAELIRAARDQVPAIEREVVLEGSFDSFTVREVLEVVGLSRQWMEVEFADPRGRLTCKSGRLIDAACGPLRGREAFLHLAEHPGSTFAVYRTGPHVLAEGRAPALAELLAEAGRAHQDDDASVVLAGDFAETTVTDLLEVLGLSRQLLEVVFDDTDGLRGVMLIKAGQVLDAQQVRSGAEGAAAFVDLVRQPGTRFNVHRRAPRQIYGEVLGPLDVLLSAVREPEPPRGTELPPSPIVPRVDAPRPARPIVALAAHSGQQELQDQVGVLTAQVEETAGSLLELSAEWGRLAAEVASLRDALARASAEASATAGSGSRTDVRNGGPTGAAPVRIIPSRAETAFMASLLVAQGLTLAVLLQLLSS